jgi:hypothetical protein
VCSVDPIRVNPGIQAPGYTGTPPTDAVCASGACKSELPVVSYDTFGKEKLDKPQRLSDVAASVPREREKEREDLYGLIEDHRKSKRDQQQSSLRLKGSAVRKRSSSICSSCGTAAADQLGRESVDAAHKKAAKAYRSGRAAWAIMITALVLLGLGLVASAVIVGLQLAKSARSMRAASALRSKEKV